MNIEEAQDILEEFLADVDVPVKVNETELPAGRWRFVLTYHQHRPPRPIYRRADRIAQLGADVEVVERKRSRNGVLESLTRRERGGNRRRPNRRLVNRRVVEDRPPRPGLRQ